MQPLGVEPGGIARLEPRRVGIEIPVLGALMAACLLQCARLLERGGAGASLGIDPVQDLSQLGPLVLVGRDGRVRVVG